MLRIVPNAWLFWAALSTLLTAMTVIFAKAGVTGVTTSLSSVFGTVAMVVTVALVAIVALQWRTLATVPPKSWAFFILMAVADVGAWICYFRALKFGDAARVASIDKFSLVIVALVSVAVLGEKLNLFNWFGVVLIVCGVALTTVN